MIERAIAGLLVVASCTPDPPDVMDPPEIEWEGQWLRFGRSPSLVPQCAGVAPYMDRYVGALVDLLEIEADVVVDFYYVDELSSPCEALGCARDDAVYSIEAVQEHELVHAVRSYEGFSHLMLEEGAAELWGDDSTKYAFRTDTTGDLLVTAELPTMDGLPSEAYGISGRFHALLHEA